MGNYETEQENFWVGDFGDKYIERNRSIKVLSSKIAMFGKILQRGRRVESCLELGANIGLNLKAIRLLIPYAQLSAVEINESAADELKQIKDVEVFRQSILDFRTDKKWDLTFTAGVLIHISPEKLNDVYDRLYQFSNRYILVTEYYNPTPVEVMYRGNIGKLFKRDFAGELMDRYVDLKLIDYGFVYHRDNIFPDDDLTWFLLEKEGGKVE